MIFDKLYKELMLENSKPRSYSCLMLDCADFKSELKKIQDQIDKDDLYTEEKGFGLETEPHITALYGIHEQDPSVVKGLLELKPLKYELTKLSLFENDKYDVLKCSVKSPDLKKMNKQCCDNLEFSSDYPDYIPHLTVAYLKPGMGKKYTSLKSKGFNKEYTSGRYLFSNKDSKKTHWNIK
jgi:2'-5' RNA ligase